MILINGYKYFYHNFVYFCFYYSYEKQDIDMMIHKPQLYTISIPELNIYELLEIPDDKTSMSIKHIPIYPIYIFNSMRYKKRYIYYINNIQYGSIPIIPYEETNIRIGFYSCNQNYSHISRENFDRNDILYQYYDEIFYTNQIEYHDNTLWKNMCNQKLDILFHLGDNIYSNAIYLYERKKISEQQIYEINKKLYEIQYKECYQNFVMRHCMNLMIEDNNDIISELGKKTKYSIHNEQFRNIYYKCKIQLKQYQIQDPYGYIYNEFGYMYEIGNIGICVLNCNMSLFQYQITLCDELLLFLHNYLYTIGINKNYNIIFMSKPLHNYSRQRTRQNKNRKSNTFELNYDNYTKFIREIEYFKFMTGKQIIIIGGDNHLYFCKKHILKNTSFYDICSSKISFKYKYENYNYFANNSEENIDCIKYGFDCNYGIIEPNDNKLIFVIKKDYKDIIQTKKIQLMK